MKYQIGDTVVILHTNEEGKVVDLINDKMLLVEVRSVSFPVYMDQVDFPYFKRFTEKKKLLTTPAKNYVDDVRKEKRETIPQKSDGVWLTFIPIMDTDEFGDVVVEQLKLHLVNRTEYPYHFNYQLHFFGKSDFQLKNTIASFQDFYLHDVDFADLNDSPSFEFDFSLTEKIKGKASHFETVVKLKPKQLFAKIEELKQKNLATFSQLLFEKYPHEQIEDKIEMGQLASKGYKIYEASKGRQHLPPPRTVIDLHIEKLTADYRTMSNYEIVSLQLSTFKKYYDLALAHRQPTLIVVHGVGEGVLRNEIHAILRLKREVKSFVNQYHPSFGYGATEIFFQY